ncbi:Bug family tripartite tricarboxylate transporter substrate binding protein [Aquabacterium sp. J223]|uniref:Bug family tripartite tricarboxylate transporter substrate binding protein n=1 Tax=Aquabacterium sp. J223 TaxID=2898431 RepID=UPI0021AE3104|nr:tripartite tricarboxylate transporter substrate-binding protein [Aquabacterium sp. J223]UUX94811.1 tripartite tricarboxylate transporter substrate binding protein [Aquabacterium sp. J223]
MTNRRDLLVRAASLAAAGGLPLAAQAQGSGAAANWPRGPVRIIVPNVPGGALDITARLLESELSKIWKQPIVVEFKPGAGTITGTDFVAKSPPDGHTLGILAIGVLGIQPALRKDMPFDTLRDLSGTMLVVGNTVLTASPQLGVNNLAELIAYGKANKGKLTYATAGSGSSMHLAGEQINLLTGIEMTHIPYKGAGGAYGDVFENRVNLLIDPLFSTMPHIKSGRLKPIAMMSVKRDPSAPEIPAAGETFPDFDFASNIGIGLPRATPREIITKINADVNRVIRSEALAPRLKEMGLIVTGSTPEQFDEHMRKSLRNFADIVQKAKVTI